MSLNSRRKTGTMIEALAGLEVPPLPLCTLMVAILHVETGNSCTVMSLGDGSALYARNHMNE